MLTHGCLQQFNIGFIRNSIKTFETILNKNVLFVGLPYTEASFFSFNHIPCQSLPSAANNSGQPNKMVDKYNCVQLNIKAVTWQLGVHCRGERIIRYSNIIRIIFEYQNIRIRIRSIFSNRIIFVLVFVQLFSSNQITFV